MDAPIVTDRRDSAALLTINRPHKANAYDAAVLSALQAALDALRRDAGVRVVVISGAGTHFCAGADLHEMRERRAIDALNLESARVFDRLAAHPTPTIAAVNGAALGGGLELALACDLRVAAEGAVFGLPETSLGIIPAAGGTLRLPRIIGMPRAKELIFTGRRLSAAEALQLGLVNRVVPATSLIDAAFELAADIARNDPLAISLAKQSLDNAVPGYAGVAQALLYHQRGTKANA